MDKASKKQLNSALKAVIDRLEKTEKFVLGELPELCQQIVKERAVVEKFDAVSQGVSAFVNFSICVATAVYAFSYSKSDTLAAIVLGVVSMAFGIMGLCAAEYTLGSIRNLVSLKAAPKLYILNKLRDLVSK